jgi:hypothetical protein
MNDLHAMGHQDAAHDIDRGIVTIEERGRCDKSNFIGGFVSGWLLGNW